jgi:CRISPR-associated exonuclease Cas4
LAAYCLLVEEEFGTPPPYGLIHYDDATIRIPFDRQLRRFLLDTLDEMRGARTLASVDRDHDSPQKCLRCGQRANCSQRLA